MADTSDRSQWRPCSLAVSLVSLGGGILIWCHICSLTHWLPLIGYSFWRVTFWWITDFVMKLLIRAITETGRGCCLAWPCGRDVELCAFDTVGSTPFFLSLALGCPWQFYDQGGITGCGKAVNIKTADIGGQVLLCIQPCWITITGWFWGVFFCSMFTSTSYLRLRYSLHHTSVDYFVQAAVV